MLHLGAVYSIHILTKSLTHFSAVCHALFGSLPRLIVKLIHILRKLLKHIYWQFFTHFWKFLMHFWKFLMHFWQFLTHFSEVSHVFFSIFSLVFLTFLMYFSKVSNAKKVCLRFLLIHVWKFLTVFSVLYETLATIIVVTMNLRCTLEENLDTEWKNVFSKNQKNVCSHYKYITVYTGQWTPEKAWHTITYCSTHPTVWVVGYMCHPLQYVLTYYIYYCLCTMYSANRKSLVYQRLAHTSLMVVFGATTP